MSERTHLATEHERDQIESAFTGVLRRLFASDVTIVAVVFVDSEGECVDYCGSLEPYELRVVGAQMQVVINNLRGPLMRLSLGELGELHVHCDRYELVVRRIDPEYTCVVMRREGDSDDVMLTALDEAVDSLRELAGLVVPAWDTLGGGLGVDVRDSEVWGYAPAAIHAPDRSLAIEGVIGRWVESGGLTGRPLICFRVHTSDGREATLVHDEAHQRWYRW